MRNNELEEGEACSFHNDDENIDPDRDFGYIDKKIESVLGPYQKDFMGGLYAESLGARFGAYGSFLPMQQRSPSVFSDERSQSHVSSKSPLNPPPRRSHPNHAGAPNISIPVKPHTAPSANGTKAVSESRALSMNNLPKLQDPSKSACNKQQKEPMPQFSKQNPLKLRVKMTAETALPYDKSVIYSGLGLDISPSSSLEDSHSDSDDDLLGAQVKTESPSYILEVMTTLPLSNDELLSPLHDSLVVLSPKGKNEETCIPGYAQTLVAAGKKETSNGKKSSKDKGSSKDRKMKKELRKERKLKEAAHQSVSHVEQMTGNRDYPANAAVFSVNGKGNVSEERELTVSKALMYDKSIGRSSEDDIGSLSGRTRVNKSDISVPQGEYREEENSRFQKQGHMKDKVKERVLSTKGSNPDKDKETISKDKEASLLSMNDVVGDDEHGGTYEEIKDCSTREPSKQKTRVRVMPHSQVEDGLLSGKKKSLENQTEGRCSEEPPRESSVVGGIGVGKGNISIKSKKGDSDLRKEVKKEYKVGTNVGSNKKAKGASLKDFEMGDPEREISVSPNKQKDKSSFKKKEIVEGAVPTIGGLVGGNSEGNMCVNLGPAEIVPHDNWVQCDKCHKWRLLPSGMSPDSLPKVWKCSMLTWLPGKNKCSVSEEETNGPPGPTLLQNNQVVYPDVGPFLGVSGGIPHVGTSSHTSTIHASKRQELLKTDFDVAKRSGFQDPVPLKKDHLLSSESASRNLKKLPRDPNASRRTGDVKPTKHGRKREADFEAYEVSKKMKRAHRQSIGNPYLSSLSTVEAKGDLTPSEIAQDYGKRPLKPSHVKLKDRTQNSVIPNPKHSEIKDSGKKRKLKDQVESTTLEYDPGIKRSSREEMKEGKSKASNFQSREGTTLSDGGNPKRGRHDDISLQRVSNIRNSSEKPLGLGVSDNATTSSSSKVSCKRKANTSQVKSSPIGPISSSTLGLSKCDSDKGTSKMSASYKESLDLSSSKQLKSNLFRSSGADANADSNNSMRNKSAGKRPSSHITTEDCKHASDKLDHHMIEDSGGFGSHHNLPSGDQILKSLNRVRVDEANSRRTKVRDPLNGSEKGTSYHSYGVPENEGPANVGNVSLRHTQSTTQSLDVELDVKKGSLHRAAKTALKEATNLKQSANRLKISGSTNESTELFFQAALKFLHGASLLEPDNNESGRDGEMASIDVYSTTATLCEYCAREYERGNNLASAALAYKCMEVAYMRVVYCTDVVVSRDRTELQTTVRVAPQVESPSSSASDVDNLNNQTAAIETMKDGPSALLDHRAHVISAECRPSFSRLLNFTEDINRAMEASRRSQTAFEGASTMLAQTGKHAVISSIKTILDFSFHDIEGFLHLVRLAMESMNTM